jgi:hypothetical protein
MRNAKQNKMFTLRKVAVTPKKKFCPTFTSGTVLLVLVSSVNVGVTYTHNASYLRQSMDLRCMKPNVPDRRAEFCTDAQNLAQAVALLNG